MEVSVPLIGPVGPKVATPWSPNQSEKRPLALGRLGSVGANANVPAWVPVSLNVIPSGWTVKWNTELNVKVTIPGGDNIIEQVRELTNGRGADLTIETTGILKQLESSVHMTRFGGKVLMFGIYTVKEGALPFYDLYFKEISLISARVAKAEDYPASIALVERGQVRLEPLVSDVMPLGELKAAIGLLGSDSGQRMKIILDHK